MHLVEVMGLALDLLVVWVVPHLPWVWYQQLYMPRPQQLQTSTSPRWGPNPPLQRHPNDIANLARWLVSRNVVDIHANWDDPSPLIHWHVISETPTKLWPMDIQSLANHGVAIAKLLWVLWDHLWDPPPVLP